MHLSHLYIVFHFILFILVFIVASVELAFIGLKLFFKPTVNKLYYYYYYFYDRSERCISRGWQS